MKNANKTGSVYKLSGNRRKPWRVVVTDGWTIGENGKKKQIRTNLGYFETRKDANIALAEYLKDPYEVDSKTITFKEVYDMWSKEHYKKVKSQTKRCYISAYDRCASLYGMAFKDIKAAHLEAILTDENVGAGTRSHIKVLFNLLFKYALKHDIITKNYASLTNGVTVKTKRKRNIFTNDEIERLFELGTKYYADYILISIYSGMRPNEMCELTLDMINLEEGYFQHGIKTPAGEGRIIPIHSKIRKLVEFRVNRAKELGLNDFTFYTTDYGKNTWLYYGKYYEFFKEYCNDFNVVHVPYDTRHTFSTLAKEADMNEYCLKLIIGHSIQDLTERVYTHRSIENLKKEMEKIK